ncbi:MAG: cory-CC-star protein [Acidobacteriota bacterium]
MKPHAVSRILARVGEALWGMAFLRYERDLRGQVVELNDLFLLICFMESVGLPNPAMAYLLEVYPLLLDECHLWHRRMGMDRSPLASLPCC